MSARRVGAVVLAALLGAAPCAYADKQITAVTGDSFSPPDVTMDQGEPLTFRNLALDDTHDVTSRTEGAGGQPLFGTPVIGFNEERFVAGSQYLTTGNYAFLCSLHPFMTGTLHVSPAGTPVPRPGGTTPPSGAVDTRAPGVKVAIRSGRLDRIVRGVRLPVRIAVDEAAQVTVVARARAGGRRVMFRKVAKSYSAPGARLVRLVLGRKARALLGRRSAARISATVRARDAAGNESVARAARFLRR